MSRPDQANSSVPESLTIILQAGDLKHLRDYREAEHALVPAHWPDEAKQGNVPDIYLEHFRKQKKKAAYALAEILSDELDAQLAPSPSHFR